MCFKILLEIVHLLIEHVLTTKISKTVKWSYQTNQSTKKQINKQKRNKEGLGAGGGRGWKQTTKQQSPGPCTRESRFPHILLRAQRSPVL